MLTPAEEALVELPYANQGASHALTALARGKVIVLAAGPAKCQHQFLQTLRGSIETFAGINFFDFDDASATPTYRLDRVDAVPSIANEQIFNNLRHSRSPSAIRRQVGKLGPA